MSHLRAAGSGRRDNSRLRCTCSVDKATALRARWMTSTGSKADNALGSKRNVRDKEYEHGDQEKDTIRDPA